VRSYLHSGSWPDSWPSERFIKRVDISKEFLEYELAGLMSWQANVPSEKVF
jgi:hypothetical protein